MEPQHPDWTIRFDGRASPPLLDVLHGPAGRALLAMVDARPDLVDLRLRRDPSGRAYAALHAGERPLIRLTEQHGALHVEVGGAVVASGLAVADVDRAWPSVALALAATAQAALRREPSSSERLETLLANGRAGDLAVLARRLAPDEAPTAEVRGLRALLTRRLRGVVPGLASGPPAGSAPALLALDARQSLLVVEVADGADGPAAEAALVRARWWAELLAQWVADDALARVRLLEVLDQRRALGLVHAEVDDLRTPLRLVPVLAVGAMGAPAEARLDVLARELRGVAPSHPAVQRAERWALDASGRRVRGEETAA